MRNYYYANKNGEKLSLWDICDAYKKNLEDLLKDFHKHGEVSYYSIDYEPFGLIVFKSEKEIREFFEKKFASRVNEYLRYQRDDSHEFVKIIAKCFMENKIIWKLLINVIPKKEKVNV